MPRVHQMLFVTQQGIGEQVPDGIGAVKELLHNDVFDFRSPRSGWRPEHITPETIGRIAER